MLKQKLKMIIQLIHRLILCKIYVYIDFIESYCSHYNEKVQTVIVSIFVFVCLCQCDMCLCQVAMCLRQCTCASVSKHCAYVRQVLTLTLLDEHTITLKSKRIEVRLETSTKHRKQHKTVTPSIKVTKNLNPEI